MRDPDAYTISPYGRAYCPVCGKDISLTKAGILRLHADPTRRGMNCPAREPKESS